MLLDESEGSEEMKKVIDFILGFAKKVGEDESMVYAYKLTYGLLLSIFPFLIFLLSVIAYLGLDAGYILNLMENSLPEEIYELISGPVLDLVLVQRGSLLTASILLAVYTASGGFRAFMIAMNRAMDFKDSRNIIKNYVLSILWVIQLAFSILVALVGIVFGRTILNLISSYFPHFPTEGFINLVRILLPVGLILGLLILAYMFIPVKNVRFKYALPGAVFSTFVWILVTLGFQYYINNFANYSRFYGTLGAVIGLLLWLLLTSSIMVLGAELNAYLIQYRNVKRPYLRSFREWRKSMFKEPLKKEEEASHELLLTETEEKFQKLKDQLETSDDQEPVE